MKTLCLMLKEFLQKKQNAQEVEAVTWFRRRFPYHEEMEMISRSQILLKSSKRLIHFFFFFFPMTSGFWLFCRMVYNYCKTISTPNWKLMALYSFLANGIHLTEQMITLTNPLFIYILGTVRSTLSCIYKPHCHANHCYDNFLLNMNFVWVNRVLS